MGNTQNKARTVVGRPVSVADTKPVMAQIVADPTESFIDPTQLAVIKNLIAKNTTMFSTYLHERKTICDRNLHTQELRILLDNRLFGAVETYVSYTRYVNVDLEAAFADRPVTLRHISMDSSTYTNITMTWAALVAIGEDNIDMFMRNQSMFYRLYFVAFDDPRFTYVQVKKFLKAITSDENRYRKSLGTVNDMLKMGAYRTARFVLTRDAVASIPINDLLRLYKIKPFDTSKVSYQKLTDTASPEVIKFFAKLDQAKFDEIATTVDWNSDQPNIETCVLLLSDAAFEIAMGLVWKQDLVARWRKLRQSVGPVIQ